MKRIIVLSLAIVLLSSAFAGVSAAPTVRIASKNFTEQYIAAEIMALLLEDAGFSVDRNIPMGSSPIIHRALTSGQIDIYAEYTGTALMVMLDFDIIYDPDEAYEVVKKEYRDRFNIEWLEPWGLNNTYAIAIRGDFAEENGIESISDLEPFASKMTLGTDVEFEQRQDGYRNFKNAYFPFRRVRGMDVSLMYPAIDNKQVEVITAFATDPRIQRLNLKVLEDDKKFFPPYHIAPIVRLELLEEHPEIADVLNQLGGRITDDVMMRLNYKVDIDGMTYERVAREWLQEEGLIE